MYIIVLDSENTTCTKVNLELLIRCSSFLLSLIQKKAVAALLFSVTIKRQQESSVIRLCSQAITGNILDRSNIMTKIHG